MAAGSSSPLDAGNDENDDDDDKEHQQINHPFQHATTEPSEAAKLFRESEKKHVIETRTETTAARRKSRGDDASDEQREEENDADEGEIKEDDDADAVARYKRQKRSR